MFPPHLQHISNTWVQYCCQVAKSNLNLLGLGIVLSDGSLGRSVGSEKHWRIIRYHYPKNAEHPNPWLHNRPRKQGCLLCCCWCHNHEEDPSLAAQTPLPPAVSATATAAAAYAARAPATELLLLVSPLPARPSATAASFPLLLLLGMLQRVRV